MKSSYNFLHENYCMVKNKQVSLYKQYYVQNKRPTLEGCYRGNV